MAARHSVAHLSRRTAGAIANTPVRASWAAKDVAPRARTFATPVPPVTQNAVGSKGPTAMVFLNMGGPSTVDEVENFLQRLFV
jgi:ferrochelatase